MAEIRYQEWPDQHEKNNYPFSDSATFEATTGEILPKDMFIDGGLHPVGGVAPFYITRMERDGNDVTIYISDATITAASGYSFYTTFTPADEPAKLELIDSYGRAAGILVTNQERIRELADIVGAAIEFEPTALEFVAAVSIPLPATGVRGLLLEDGTAFFGKVVIAGENGVIVSGDGGAIRIDVVGDPYYNNKCLEERGLTPEVFCGVKTINGISPDADGDFKITPGSALSSDSILRIEPTTNGIRILTVPESGNA